MTTSTKTTTTTTTSLSSRIISKKRVKLDGASVVVESEDDKLGNAIKKIEGDTLYRHFRTPQVFRSWLQDNHKTSKEIFICFYTKASGKMDKCISYVEALDVALCFGWIDGVRRRIDEESYCNRFTPRRADGKSNWSSININKVEELIKQNLMTEAGLLAYSKRMVATVHDAIKMENKKIDGQYLERLKSEKKAYKYFLSTTESYQRMANRYVMLPVREQTIWGRLDKLIEASKKQEKMYPFNTTAAEKKKTTAKNKRKQESSSEDESEYSSEEDDESEDQSSSSSTD
ncbi:hypothetical protein SAMD00019534_115530 [Acytostelium subglobosum LB1]|uniref:hypothetical protein n=1 Tax=Acytostelium subglobosum LB1 TaxID=1410327 RepID=UPI0006449CC4|nr:hypothetical protein SAMD00019534_115530 [Acytostelium subglobosum LB1]GAM28377.1 hypothetical protein SAMD00019534_115530 [Acytostelium subglobosum LB1]|eukprot:XP_012748694.1 hypothetical protein SAMD00019534_115530 [Acytostelium subglobosum LB1]